LIHRLLNINDGKRSHNVPYVCMYETPRGVHEDVARLF
jgi:hypothetical protein